MKRLILSTLLACCLSAGAAAAELRDFFPKPQEVAGWSISYDIEEYPGEEIYDFIDGAGEVFMDYNFETVASAEYTGPDDGAIVVEIYRMKTAADAYGVFTYHRPEGAEELDVEQRGFRAGITAGLWKDLYYAKVYGLEKTEGMEEAVAEFCRLISRKIPQAGNLPDIFEVLRVEGFKEGSARYLHTNLALKNLHFVSDENVLGLSEKTEMAFARYEREGREFLGFIAIYPSDEAAAEAASSYAQFLGKNKDAEAAWFKQRGKAVVGTWTGLKVAETADSEYMIYETLEDLIKQVRIYQLDR